MSYIPLFIGGFYEKRAYPLLYFMPMEFRIDRTCPPLSIFTLDREVVMHSVWKGKHKCGKVFDIVEECISGKDFKSFYPIEENRNLSVCPKCGKELRIKEFSSIIEKEGGVSF